MEGRHTIFFTLLNPFLEYSGEEHDDYFSRSRKVHYVSNKHFQDAVYWVKLSRAQDHGLRFWETKSNAKILDNPVLIDCIYTVTSQT